MARRRFRRKATTRIIRMPGRTRYIRSGYRRSRRGSSLLGTSLKGALIGGIGLMGVKVLRSRFIDLGAYNAPVETLATGAILSALKQDNKDMLSVGIKMAAAQVGTDLINGTLLGGSTSSDGAV